jgi:hypothetical protein
VASVVGALKQPLIFLHPDRPVINSLAMTGTSNWFGWTGSGSSTGTGITSHLPSGQGCGDALGLRPAAGVPADLDPAVRAAGTQSISVHLRAETTATSSFPAFDASARQFP